MLTTSTTNKPVFLTLFLAILVCSKLDTRCFAQGYPPNEAAKHMTVAEGFKVELAASEPLVRQPVAIDFDDRGRLWVLQYLQYPNPAGLKRIKVDRFSRTTYDRIPEPPPFGPKGADRLTILEDTDSDGQFDKAKDFISDLNIATGFTFGHGGVFVLQTPYLLFYPDKNRDDVPDGNPEVLLKGFGMEDTSSLANSLVWGPDGWLYGTQGTNITANIRGITFEQGLWRYHPVTKKFELFMEGGGNMWGLDFDRSGKLIAGTNHGGYLMFHGVQGAYYEKAFAKHGELHNPFAFGYFNHVPHKNFKGGHVTVGGVLYQSEMFPPRFRDKYIAVDTLGHAVRWHHVKSNQSSLRSENGGVLFEANDTWFAPSDAVYGPDGAIYIADWHDKRTAHPDPDATWDRRNGRVFRLRWNAAKPVKHINPQSLSSDQLVENLSSADEWKVRRSRLIIAERRDPQVAKIIRETLLKSDNPRLVLQALWTLNAMGEFNEQLDAEFLEHEDPDVRSWTIRLLGDSRQVSSRSWQKLLTIAKTDRSPSVISQLASSAKRLPAQQCIPVIRAILNREEFGDDPHIPLLTWWAVERYSISNVEEVLRDFSRPDDWHTNLVRKVILGRLMRRFAGDGSQTGLAACAKLLATAPDSVQQRYMITELDSGLKMIGKKRLPGLPLSDKYGSIAAIKNVDNSSKTVRLKTIPSGLASALAEIWDDNTSDPLLIRVAMRLGSQAASDRALALVKDKQAPETTRLAMLEVLQEISESSASIEPAIKLVTDSESTALKIGALNLLSRFSEDHITQQLLIQYKEMSPEVRSHARDVLLGRVDSALAFLQEVDRGVYPLTEVTSAQLRRIALHNNELIDNLVQKHWGNISAGTPEEKLAEIRRLSNDLRAASGSVIDGKEIFKKRCATCHRYYDAGTAIGPDLTKANRQDRNFLLVSIVDPNAQIRKEYLNQIVVTNDGRVLSGLVVEKNAASVTLLSAKNERTTISRDDIDELSVSPVSMMPEGILKDLSPQQVRDLFQYLQVQK